VIEAQRRELVGEVRKLRRHQRNETEAVPVLQRRVLDLERHTGLVENPKAPKPSRRGPEGGVSVITAMSRGLGQIEKRIGKLFAATKDRALSVADICDHAFELNGATATRPQRLSATREAHRLLRGSAAANGVAEEVLQRVIAEAGALLGREPGRRGRETVYFSARGRFFRVDNEYAEAMRKTTSWPSWEAAWGQIRRWPNVAFDWRATRLRNPWGDDGMLVFHPANYPVRLWAADLDPTGMLWGEAEIVRIAQHRVHFRYRGAAGHLDRWHLSQFSALWRGVYFTAERSGRLAQFLERRWFERYYRYRPGGSVPPAMQMPLADAMRLLGQK